jgi:hypothetical protein
MSNPDILPDCPQLKRINERNGLTRCMTDSSDFGNEIALQLIEGSIGQRLDDETIELANLKAQMRITDYIERTGRWAANLTCELCRGPTTEPITGEVFCGREVPNEVFISIDRHQI